MVAIFKIYLKIVKCSEVLVLQYFNGHLFKRLLLYVKYSEYLKLWSCCMWDPLSDAVSLRIEKSEKAMRAQSKILTPCWRNYGGETPHKKHCQQLL